MSNHYRGRPGRGVALGVTALVHVAIAVVLIRDWRWPETPKAIDETIAVTLLPLASDRPAVASPPAVPAKQRKPEPAPATSAPPIVTLPSVAPIAAVESVIAPDTQPAAATDGGADDRMAQVADHYRRAVSSQLASQRHYPDTALLHHYQGEGIIRFRIDRAGRLLDAAIATSTGRSSLDQAALAMVRRSDPFPIIPAELPDQLDISLPLRFLIVDRQTSMVSR